MLFKRSVFLNHRSPLWLSLNIVKVLKVMGVQSTSLCYCWSLIHW